MIGSLPPPAVGTSVSFQHLIKAFRHHGTTPTVIDTGGIRGRGPVGVFKLAACVGSVLWQAFRHDVVALHINPWAMWLIGPYAVAVCRLSRKPLLIRLFGGNCFTEFGGLKGRLFRWSVKRSDIYLVQSHQLVASARAAGVRDVRWYPTSRPQLSSEAPQRIRCRRYVFVGWVGDEKGVADILAAARRLSQTDVTVDVYGTFRPGWSAARFAGQKVVRYRGTIPPGEATAKIAEHDALLLPTTWPCEGYPGVIIEAYQAGIPVISTRWRSIPELVDEASGILIEPGNVNELVEAMHRLSADEGLYQRLCHGASRRAQEFSTERWTREFVAMCRELIGRYKDT